MIVRCVFPTLLVLTALLTACRKPEVQSYRVPKEPAPQAPAESADSATRVASGGASVSPATKSPANPPAPGGSTMANTPVPTAGGASLTWTAPSHWTVLPATSIRKGNFSITGEGGKAELTVTAFPGDVGGDLANLNRWREQIALPPVAAGDFEKSVQRLERNGLRMIVVDIAGTGANAQRILGAMIPHGGATWFVKLGPGPDALVAKEKPAFMAFLDTLKASADAK